MEIVLWAVFNYDEGIIMARGKYNRPASSDSERLSGGGKGVIVKDLGYRRMMREMLKAPKVEVVVGYHAGQANAEGQSIAEYMAVQEYGSSGKHSWTGSKSGKETSVSGIPARPAMRNAFDKNVNQLTNMMGVSAGRIMDGTSTVYRELMFIGAAQVANIQKEIVSGDYPANAPQTIAAKGHDNVLRDTYTAFKSIRPIVRSKTTGNK
ncbi:MAG: hypothetical protein ACRDC5_06105 [Vibrio sp.]